ncbi:9915_t:CDS:2 [Paraglomus brasilianum]|uniref:9915_t:CDS:1 n=1 Tax=Paraglomus brasilianum TaxID=144538 RepID=A0A9N8VZD8_9GLOM|nr:9915_t:CDS:2 [Paraglomus brasilianum]
MSRSISEECNNLKKEYDACFNKWYSEKFLKGDCNPECDEIFAAYKECVLGAVKSKQIDKLLADARKEDPFARVASSDEKK